MISAAYGQDLVRLPLALRHSRRAGNLLLPAYAFQVIRQNPVRAPLPLRTQKDGQPDFAHICVPTHTATPVRTPDHSAAQGALCFATHMRCGANMQKKGTCGKFRKSLCRPFML